MRGKPDTQRQLSPSYSCIHSTLWSCLGGTDSYNSTIWDTSPLNVLRKGRYYTVRVRAVAATISWCLIEWQPLLFYTPLSPHNPFVSGEGVQALDQPKRQRTKLFLVTSFQRTTDTWSQRSNFGVVRDCPSIPLPHPPH